MTFHGALSIILNIRQGYKPQLLARLAEIDSDVNDNRYVPFKKIGSIHFARFVVCDAGPDVRGNMIPDRLIFTTNYDLPASNHIAELMANAGQGLWDIFSLCDGFLSGNYDAGKLSAFLVQKNLKPDTFYVGLGYRSVLQVRQENELRTAAENYIDANRDALLKLSATDIRKKITGDLLSRSEFAWARTPVAGPTAGWEAGRILKMTGIVLLLLVFSPVIVPFVIVWALIMLCIEISEKDVHCPLDYDHIRSLEAKETMIVQTQFSAVGDVKPGWFRRQTMMFLLHMTDFLAPYLFTKGKLSGIPTVHFARWLIVNEGRQMIFLSNFDGNSEGYLRDFINIAAKPLTLMFTHTVGYPKTRLMVFGGAKDSKGFMEWARAKQTITNVWYSANPGVTVRNIFQNSKIRDGFYGDMSEDAAAKWLQLF